jgi:tetratricopeptide (TPR) repeat protein
VSLELDKTAEAPEREAKPVALAAGAELGKYRLERVLGEGGMGVVWAARDPDLQRSIAIKLIKHAGAPTELRQRLLREAVAMAKLKHPNVLTVYEAGTVADRDYIAMELVEGTSLDAWLTAQPPREEVWAAIVAAGRGLAAAHDAGIVHRDFKPHNVLRSRDGRVLVTDFGLARAVLEHDDAAAGNGSVPEILDEKLTITGALVGTPAYMAPEQYRGAAPDPRTDQFAFCVTAWQALAGERPFKGQSLDELREAVSGGVAHLPAKLPGHVRAVLARGLDPDPARRWPSLDALLAELDRAARVPGRRRTLIARIAVLAIAAGLAFAIFARGYSHAVANDCEHPEAAFAEAWSPSVKSALQRAAHDAPDVDTISAAFDRFEGRWVESYQRACRNKTAKIFPARIECLEGVRDQVNGLAVMRTSAPAGVFQHFDAPAMLPQLAACERAVPQSPPALPHEPARRAKVLELYGRVMAIAAAPSDQLKTLGESLEREATALDYPPAVATIAVMTADAYLRQGRGDHARAAYQRALPLAKAAGDHRLEARVHIGLLELAMTVLANPAAPVPAKLDDPRAQPVLHPELANAFAAARSAANDDPLLLGSIEVTAANAYLQLAQYNRYHSAYDEALARATEARKLFDGIGDVVRSARASALEAEIYLARGDERALDDAQFAARRAGDMLAAAGRPALPELDTIRARVAFARRDYNEVHRIYDAYTKPPEPPAATISGRVVPPGRVRIIAWSVQLRGDPRRGYTTASQYPYDVTESAADGTFTIHAQHDWGLLAEAGDTRAIAPASDGVVLRLRPTITQSGTVTGKNLLGVRAFALYHGGWGTVWRLEVPVERDGTFDLRGMPGPADEYGLYGEAGEGIRTVRSKSASTLVWPSGQTLDVIVRGDHPGAISASTSWRDEATASPHPVGASNTDAGREEYRPGDQHAVITGNATGPVEVCAGSLLCKTIDVRPTVEVDYPDGRYAAGVTPIVLGP